MHRDRTETMNRWKKENICSVPKTVRTQSRQQSKWDFLFLDVLWFANLANRLFKQIKSYRVTLYVRIDFLRSPHSWASYVSNSENMKTCSCMLKNASSKKSVFSLFSKQWMSTACNIFDISVSQREIKRWANSWVFFKPVIHKSQSGCRDKIPEVPQNIEIKVFLKCFIANGSQKVIIWHGARPPIVLVLMGALNPKRLKNSPLSCWLSKEKVLFLRSKCGPRLLINF